MESRARLLLFAKAPAPGRVKTRLAASLGAREASEWAVAFLLDSWELASSVEGASTALVLDGDARLVRLVPEPEIWPQGSGDLGARLERGFRRALAAAPCAIAIGSDSPSLPRERLDEALRALAGPTDAVIGPADDGGFYLLGLRRCPPGLLADLPWSEATTASAVRARLAREGFALSSLPPHHDVDDEPGLRRLERELGDRPGVARHCRARFEASRTPAHEAEPATTRLSVIVPVLNERRQLPLQLAALADQPGLHEVIVVDGGSEDESVSIAREAGVRVVRCERGRARQMNAGARAATGDAFVFLHVDTRLPAGAAAHIRAVLADEKVVAGAFRTWTLPDDPTRRAVWLHLADLRSRYSRTPYGDQAPFVRRDAFEAVGGFPDQPLMEDYELSRRLRRLGRIEISPRRVRVSGRRFLRHPLRYAVLVNAYPLLYRFGVSPETLRRHYRDVR